MLGKASRIKYERKGGSCFFFRPAIQKGKLFHNRRGDPRESLYEGPGLSRELARKLLLLKNLFYYLSVFGGE